MALGTRWLGVGLATALAVVTIGLWATGQIGLYINPDAAWWAVSMAIVCVVGAVWSCTVPISRDHEHEHEHEHDDDHEVPVVPSTGSGTEGARSGAEGARFGAESARSTGEGTGARPVALLATGVGAVLASGLVVLAVVMPPASLSAELALARSSGAPPVLSTSATLALDTFIATQDWEPLHDLANEFRDVKVTKSVSKFILQSFFHFVREHRLDEFDS